MNKKMSELFHEFVHDNDFNGNDEIIRETNAVVAEDDIEVRTMLDDGVGEKYFYRCMELAENVIKSFKDEQPQLNDNQKIVLEWLKVNVLQDGESAMSSIFELGALWELRRFNDNDAIRVDDAYCELSNAQEFEVLAVFAQWGLEQEEENNDH
ncbi:hypothetical protein P7H53_05995 [Enterococcus thailandicus]|uniref:hypothetical protein n=1 Tax=Enterococcus thailandicus TaxID=417368 RepID=UPI00288EEB4A|nr:hypothetical protein [Enterococcus thailandicus]MDT2794275.1 hypothetical protein [Enterococcus thailandicus]